MYVVDGEAYSRLAVWEGDAADAIYADVIVWHGQYAPNDLGAYEARYDSETGERLDDPAESAWVRPPQYVVRAEVEYGLKDFDNGERKTFSLRMAEEHGTSNCWHHENGFVYCTAGQAQRIIKNLHAGIEYGVMNDVGDYHERTRVTGWFLGSEVVWEVWNP